MYQPVVHTELAAAFPSACTASERLPDIQFYETERDARELVDVTDGIDRLEARSLVGTYSVLSLWALCLCGEFSFLD